MKKYIVLGVCFLILTMSLMVLAYSHVAINTDYMLAGGEVRTEKPEPNNPDEVAIKNTSFFLAEGTIRTEKPDPPKDPDGSEIS